MDITNIAEELGLEEEDVRRLVLTFLESTEGDLPQLSRAFAEGDAEKMRAVAHHIKGAAANLELNRIAATAKLVEDKARRGVLEDPAAHVQMIHDRLESIRTQVSAKE